MRKVFIYVPAATSKVLLLLVQYLLIAVLSRHGGVDLTGAYGQFLGLLSVFSIITAYGQPAAVFRSIPPLIEDRNFTETRSICESSFKITFCCSLGLGLLLVLISFFLLDSWKYVLLLYGLIIINSVLLVSSAVLRVFQEIFLSEIVKNVLWRFFLILGVFLVIGIDVHLDYTRLYTVMLISILMSLILSMFILWTKYQIQPFNKNELIYVEGNKSTWLIDICQVIVQQADVVLVAHLLGFEEAGVYFVLARISNIVAIPLSITNPTIVAPLSRIASDRASSLDRSKIYINSLLNITLAIALFGTILIVQNQIVWAISGRENEYEVVLAIMLVGQFINTIAGPTLLASQIFDVRKTVLSYQLILGLIFLVSIVGATVSYGIIGTAVVVSINKILFQLVVFTAVFKKTRTWLFNGKTY